MSLKLRLQVLLLVLLVAPMATLSMVYLHLQRADELALIINLSGRQRMLSQRMTAIAHELASLDLPEDRRLARTQDFNSAVRLFESSLYSLMNGGEVTDAKGETATIPAATSAEERAALERGIELWVGFRSRSSLSTYGPESDASMFRDVRRELLQIQDTLLASMNDTTVAFQETSEAREIRLKATIVAGSLISLAIGIVLFMSMRGAVLKPIAREREEQAEYNARLEEALKAARAADEAKTRFLRTISHELRTPLNGVIGLAAVLETTTLDEEQTNCVSGIAESGERLLRLVSQVLDVTMLSDGMPRLELENTHLLNILDTCVSRLKVQDRPRVSVRLDATAPASVILNPGRVSQVIDELLVNALHPATQATFVEVIVRCVDSKLSIDVVDNGCGISAEDQTPVFEAFTQCDDKTTRKREGAGLGLTVCRMLARAMGGEILVASTQGEGSTFTLVLPMRTAVPTGA